ncbi:MAG: O-methyltransferase [Schleiferiaceae bacterium]|nr:O-methyltransferase [Schleiferiaceae bacterium]
MEFIDPKIENYAAEHSDQESEVLAKLNRETHAKVLIPRMLSGHIQGRVLSMLSKLHQPNRILEIGTYTGYSGICLAEGLKAGGHLHTIDVNEELEDMANRYFELAGLSNCITMHIGNAMEIIPKLEETWDMVFIDADKENYLNYYNLVIDRVAIGGLIIADNVLWSGKVLDDQQDEETSALDHFNKTIQQDPRVENLLLPIRDGLMCARRIR